MTCPSHGDNIRTAIRNYIGSLEVAPTTGGFIAQRLGARMDGGTQDASLGDFAGAAGITHALNMAMGQILNNHASTVAQRVAIKTGSSSPHVAEAVEINRHIDRNPNGGSGPCDDPDPNDPPGDDDPGSPNGPPLPPADWPSNGPPPPGNPGGRRGGDGNGGGRPKAHDPLVIDLDGDGAELTSLTASTVYFDYDGDGFAEQTGWIGADDGLLVLDRNANGTIDNGGELFGEATRDGFEVLRELDTNGDGRIDSSDAAFADLRIWRDANGNGVSESSELLTLGSQGVTVINLDTTHVGESIEGNWVASEAAVSLSGGGSTTISSVYFTVDAQSTEYVIPEEFEFDDLTMVLPDLKGFGSVKTLSVAISEDALLLAELRSLVIDSNGMSAADFRDRVETLVYNWVGVAEAAHSGRGSNVDYDMLAVIEAFQGEPFWQQTIDAVHADVVADQYQGVIDGIMGRLVVQMGYSYFALAMVEEREAMVLEHSLSPFGTFGYDVFTDLVQGRSDLFLAMATGRQSGTAWEQLQGIELLTDYLPSLSGILLNGDSAGFQQILADVLGANMNFGDLTLENLSLALRYDLTLGTDGADELLGGHGGDALNGGAGDDLMEGGAGNDVYIFELGSGHDIVADSLGLTNQGGQDIVRFGEGIEVGDIVVTQANDGADLVIAITGTSDQLTLRDVSNDGWRRIEEVRFADGASLTFTQLLALATTATAGDDLFYGSSSGDALGGGSGADTLIGIAGDDTLTGGAGNDLLKGGGGDDVYVFEAGFGQDVVDDANGLLDQGGSDEILFGAGITAADIIVTQADTGNDLVIAINGTADQVTLNQTSADGYARIEQVRFADSTILTHAQLMALATAPTAGDDVFYGSTAGDTLSGGGGNDTLTGRAGNDVLTGGAGNDLLKGGGGNDTYFFGLGFGQDIVRDANGLTDQGGSDTIEFGAGIAVADIIVTQADNGNDLVIAINGTADQIILDQTSADGYARIEQVRFADGTILTHSAILEMATGATAGADTFTGSSAADNLYGGRGDDTLIAKLGNDRLEGGEDNDLLKGGGGNDTYVFDLGFGQDVVSDADGLTNQGGTDNITFGIGITAADIMVSQADTGRDLVITINGTTDQITLNNTSSDGYARIEEVRFADGIVLTHADLMALATTPTSGDDIFYGSSVADTLSGGDGNDTLIADSGNDTLTGGAGNDYMKGGSGDDTYHFDAGFGQDVVRDSNGSLDQGGSETIEFGAGIGVSDIIVAQADNGSDLIIKIAGTSDQITLDSTGDGGYHRIEQVRFADSTILLHADLMALALSSRATADSYWGDGNANTLSAGDGDDAMYGRAGDDILSGDAGNDILYGEDGADTLNGGAGNDVLSGGAGNDILSGGDGDDLFLPDAGVDTIEGGAGSDTVDVSALSAAMVIDLALASSQANLGAGGIETWNDVENVIAGTGADTVYGTAASNRLSGRAGVDSLYGRDGNDVLVGGTGDDILDGGAGDDLFEIGVGDGSDTISGGDGYDTIVATAANVAIVLKPLSSIETVSAGGFANVTILGTSGANTLNFAGVTLTGIVKIDGLGGADSLTGSAGADTIVGGSGDDTLDGGAGDDVFQYSVSGDGYDHVAGGDGYDTLAATGTNAWIGLRSMSGIEAISSGGFSGVAVWGSTAADTLDFSGVTLTGIVKIDGYDGNDVLTGSAGNDVMVGGSGVDRLTGGAGVDTLTGGSGVDTFAFGEGATGLAAGADRITDFAVGSDKIDLSALDANAGVSGDQAFTFVGTAAFSGAAGELRYVKTGGDTWLQMDTDGDGMANLEIVLSGQPTVLTSDFVL